MTWQALQLVSLKVTTGKRISDIIAGAVQWHRRSTNQPTDAGQREHRPSKREKAHTLAMPSPKRRWDAENESPKANVSFTLQELNRYKNVQQNQINPEAMANA